VADIIQRDIVDCEDRLAQERFLLLTQTKLQELLRCKKVKYKDLSKRLGVSEARISQLFSDDAANLTIRTIARIYHHLDEAPVILSRKEYERLAGADMPSLHQIDAEETWQVPAADLAEFSIPRAQACTAPRSEATPRPPRNREWVDAALKRA
jgi:DNA-binding Xre family transcriptional regulator